MGKLDRKTVSHQFNVSPETVFDGWLDLALTRQWMSIALKSVGLSGEMAQVQIDPQKGGKFLFSDTRDGVEHRHWGEYLELDRPRKIAFTWNTEGFDESDPCHVYLSLEATDTGCTATIVNEMDEKWADDGGATKRGWSSMLKAQDGLLK
ncbi:MAG: SRPBCC domain-containing protein [Marinicaulis sp.]|nr:SRPBCC domain-containing protein [Marinicaulis sp.]